MLLHSMLVALALPLTRQPCNPDSVAALRALIGIPALRQMRYQPISADEPGISSTRNRVAADHGTRILASLSWSGPNGGALVLMTCDGHLLQVVQIGSVDSVRLMELGAIDSAALVYHQTGTGTGWLERAATLFVVRSDTLSAVWSAVTFQGSYEFDAYELRATVSLPSPRTIVLQGDSTALKYDQERNVYVHRGASVPFKKSFRYDAAVGAFREF